MAVPWVLQAALQGGIPCADLVACFLLSVRGHGSVHAMVGWAAKLFVLLCTTYRGDFIIKRVAICNEMGSGAVWWGTQPRVGSCCSYSSI